MGQITPDGLENKPKDVTAMAGHDTAPQPAPTDVLAHNFFRDLDLMVQSAPPAERDMAEIGANALIKEIREATGLQENRPGDDRFGASRIEQLNTAIQSSNLPENLKTSADDLFTAAVDSPHLLNRLAGLIQQGGGAIAGIAANAKQQEAQEEKRKAETERLLQTSAYASMVAAATAVAKGAAAAVFDAHAQRIGDAITHYNATRDLLPPEQRAQNLYDQAYKDATEEAFQTALEKTQEEQPELSTEKQAEIAAKAAVAEAEKSLDEQNVDAETKGLTIDLLQERVDALQHEVATGYNTKREHDQGQISSLVLGALIGNTVTGEPAPSKAEITRQIDESYQAELAKLNTTLSMGDDINERISQIEQQIAAKNSVAETMAERGRLDQAADSFAAAEELANEQKELQDLKDGLSEQLETAALQKDILEISHKYQTQLLETVNEDMSNVDMAFIKSAILNAPEELYTKSAELNARMGQADYNPFEKLIADASNAGLTEEQQAELNQLMSDVQQKVTDLAAARKNVAMQASSLLTSPNGIIMSPQDGTMRAAGISPIATPEQRLDAAVEEMQTLQGDLSELAAQNGVVLQSDTAAAPAPAPSQPSYLQVESAKIAEHLASLSNPSRADLEEMMYRAHLDTGSMRDVALDAIEAKLDEIKPDFKLREDLTLDEQIKMAFIENNGTLTPEDIGVLVGDAGYNGTEYQAKIDEIVGQYKNDPDFVIDPPIPSYSDTKMPIAKVETPAPAPTPEPAPAAPAEAPQAASPEQQRLAVAPGMTTNKTGVF